MANYPGQNNPSLYPPVSTTSAYGPNPIYPNPGIPTQNPQYFPPNTSYPNQNVAYTNPSQYPAYPSPNYSYPANQNPCSNQNPAFPQFGNILQAGAAYPYYPPPNNQYPNPSMFQPAYSQPLAYPPGMQPMPGVPMTTQMSVPMGPNNYSAGVSTAGCMQNSKKFKERYIAPAIPRPSLVPNMSADPSTDAYALNKAYKGFGCNKEAVRNIIARRNCAQRERIKLEYQTRFGKSLIDHTKSELTEPYERVIISLLWTGSDLDAFMMYKASKGIGTDESAYRDIICTRSSAQLAQIKASYQKIYNKNLVNVVKSETSGCFQDILLSLLNNPRDQCPNVDFELAKRDAADLFSTKTFKITAPSSLINIFAKRSNTQLLQTFKTYQEMSGNTVYNYLKQFIESDYQKCLMTILNFLINPIRYYSKHLREGILKQSIYQIIRIVSTRCEIDLYTIIEDYNFTYKTNFANDFQNVFIDAAGHDTMETILILIGVK